MTQHGKTHAVHVIVSDQFVPVRQSVDIPYTDEHDAGAYEYRTPYLCSEELGDVCEQSLTTQEDQWDIEVQAYDEDWDNAPDFRPPVVFRGSSKPAPMVDYAEANHLYISAANMAFIEMMNLAARRVNYNPPKKRMSTTVTVPNIRKEVPKSEKPKYVGVNKMGKSIRISLKDLPLFKYRGWKEMTA